MFEVGKKKDSSKKDDPKAKAKDAAKPKAEDKPKDDKKAPKKDASPAKAAAAPPMVAPTEAPMAPMEPEMPMEGLLSDEGALPTDMGAAPMGGPVDKAVVVYMGSEFGPFECQNCMHFQAPGACEVVAGDIDPMGVCHVFEPSQNGMTPPPDMAAMAPEMGLEPPMDEEIPLEEPSMMPEGV